MIKEFFLPHTYKRGRGREKKKVEVSGNSFSLQFCLIHKEKNMQIVDFENDLDSIILSYLLDTGLHLTD